MIDVLPTLKDPARIKAFVDFQNDATAKDITLAVRESFRSIEHIKRYTTNGKATDQGKTSNLNSRQIAPAASAKPATDIGLTTFCPPYTPQTFGVLAGHAKSKLFQAARKTDIDPWAQQNGAALLRAYGRSNRNWGGMIINPAVFNPAAMISLAVILFSVIAQAVSTDIFSALRGGINRVILILSEVNMWAAAALASFVAIALILIFCVTGWDSGILVIGTITAGGHTETPLRQNDLAMCSERNRRCAVNERRSFIITSRGNFCWVAVGADIVVKVCWHAQGIIGIPPKSRRHLIIKLAIIRLY